MSKFNIKVFLICLIALLLVLSLVGVLAKYYNEKGVANPVTNNNVTNDNPINEEYEEVDSSTGELVPQIDSDSLKDEGEYIFTNFKNKIYYFNQQDYAKERYGTYGTIKGYGCGPTVMAMVLSSFLNEKITPVETTSWACSHNYCSEEGTNNKFFFAMANIYNLKAEGPFDSSKEENRDMVYEVLSKGEALVIMSVGYGDFYKGGHYMLLAGLNENNVVVADPNSRENTKPYSYEYLMSKSANPQNFYIIKEGD